MIRSKRTVYRRVIERFEQIFNDAFPNALAWNKKKAPIGALLVLAAVIFLFGSYLLQYLSLAMLTV